MSNSFGLVFEKQYIQYIAAILSIIGFWLLFPIIPIQNMEILGLDTKVWYWIAVAVPITHQLVIGFLWRMELHRKSLTRFFGSTDKGFKFFQIIFSILFVSRMVSLIILSIADFESISLHIAIRVVLSIIIFVPAAYLFYSVKKYFGIKRAYGADHFYDEYKSMTMVKEGIFKYTNNGMYTFGLLILWIPGILAASLSAIAIGIFNHLFVWIHYFSTEKPDMKRIYG